jgi:hypothetical protein
MRRPFSGQCALCHPLARIYLQPVATDWAVVIDRMNANHAKTFGQSGWTELTPARKTAIVEFMKSRTRSAGEFVVRGKCTKCHALTNLTKQAQGADWTAIIDRMIKKHGAKLTTAEQQDAINFLKGQ